MPRTPCRVGQHAGRRGAAASGADRGRNHSPERSIAGDDAVGDRRRRPMESLWALAGERKPAAPHDDHRPHRAVGRQRDHRLLVWGLEMKDAEERAEEQGRPLFEVHQTGNTTLYEAAKGVDWLSLFADESADGRSKLIDLPHEPVVPASPGPPARPIEAREPPTREHAPRVVIAASIIAVFGTTTFLFWLVASPAFQDQDRQVDRLTLDALAPSASPIPGPVMERSPSPSPPFDRERAAFAAPPAPTPTPAPPKPTPATPPRTTPAATPRVTPRATPTTTPRATPSPSPRTTPAVTPQATSAAPVLQSQPASAPPPPPLTATPSPSPSASVTPPPAELSSPPPRGASSPRPSSTPLPTPSPTPAAPTPAPGPSPAALERAAVRAVLDNYRAAYQSLRAESVKAVWPGANTQALSRAFGQIASQSMDFYTCGIEVNADGAEATCTGSVTFVPKVGAKTPRVEPRGWTFHLTKQGDRWIIDRVTSR